MYMYPKNVMENAVLESLSSHRTAAGADPVCWCQLCTADMQALALSSLPPRYVTRREGVAVDAVHDEVARAVGHVCNHPKHPPGTCVAPAETVAVVNFTFEVGFALIEERMRLVSGSCECWDCRCDAVAFALNRFPPQYGVAVGGRSAFSEGSRRQMADELVSFMDLGVRIATTLPRHEASS